MASGPAQGDRREGRGLLPGFVDLERAARHLSWLTQRLMVRYVSGRNCKPRSSMFFFFSLTRDSRKMSQNLCRWSQKMMVLEDLGYPRPRATELGWFYGPWAIVKENRSSVPQRQVFFTQNQVFCNLSST